ncbi:MAG: hypothetical protein E6J71_14130 [Deltaproteobacteria bacterium]|nr:MAG: hypothetical protein E6J76_07105 [Deltaproteobacteria bacterium]TMB17721.1 MAG: hypothetical protein E6J71_14130 [Deltaproteobacteria bacterium]
MRGGARFRPGDSSSAPERPHTPRRSPPAPPHRRRTRRTTRRPRAAGGRRGSARRDTAAVLASSPWPHPPRASHSPPRVRATRDSS